MHALLLAESVCPPPAAATAEAPPAAAAALQTAAKPRTIVVGSARMDRPARPGSLCWYCAHPAERMLPMPVGYDPRTDVFRVMGSFCGFPCMKSFNLERDSYLKHVNASTISLFAKRCTGGAKRIRLAPPRAALRAFGGSLSIEEFRDEGGPDWAVPPPKQVSADVVIQEQRACGGRKPAKAVNLAASVDFKDVAVKNETLKLRRPKPMQTTRNALDRAMGINQLLMSV